MSVNTGVVVDIERELEQIEYEIETHKGIIENLTWRRSELLINREDLEMCELIDCIVEKGITANEALGIINSVSMRSAGKI
jgi:ribosomal protein RSM22 (predicted rRNA methylase)